MRRTNSPRKPKKSGSGPDELSTSEVGGAYSFLSRLPRAKPQDPRFREECGEIDHVGLVKNYAFLQDYRQAEISSLNQQMRDADPAAREKLKNQKRSLQDQCRTFDNKLKTVEESITWHREERQRVLDGKKPFWLDKRGMKEAKQRKKYEELAETGKLDRYLNRRGKKLAAKDKKEGRIAGFM
jgi:ribosomal RNA-processing protein 36